MNLQFSNLQLKQEVEKIIKFIQTTLKTQGFKKTVIAVSGGVDSAVCLTLLCRAIGPKNIIVLKLPYGKQEMKMADLIIQQTKIPKENVKEINIAKIVDKIASLLRSAGWQMADCFITDKKKINNGTMEQWNNGTINKVRLGNITARVRMIIVYDMAKKYQALVCGTENKSEYLLGYFTRFGDEASDFEPIRHLYKTRVYQLAKHFDIPNQIIQAPASAGLWPNQEDEKELGFTYQEADQVLYLYSEKNLSLKKISSKGYQNAEKIIRRLKQNSFKHQVPYSCSMITGLS